MSGFVPDVFAAAAVVAAAAAAVVAAAAAAVVAAAVPAVAAAVAAVVVATVVVVQAFEFFERDSEGLKNCHLSCFQFSAPCGQYYKHEFLAHYSLPSSRWRMQA